MTDKPRQCATDGCDGLIYGEATHCQACINERRIQVAGKLDRRKRRGMSRSIRKKNKRSCPPMWCSNEKPIGRFDQTEPILLWILRGRLELVRVQLDFVRALFWLGCDAASRNVFRAVGRKHELPARVQCNVAASPGESPSARRRGSASTMACDATRTATTPQRPRQTTSRFSVPNLTKASSGRTRWSGTRGGSCRRPRGAAGGGSADTGIPHPPMPRSRYRIAAGPRRCR